MSLYPRSKLFSLHHSAVRVTHTGILTTETVLRTITIPGGAMGVNGGLRLTALLGVTNNANNKIIKVRWGGLTGNAIYDQTLTTTAFNKFQVSVHNRNNLASQVAAPTINGGFGSSTNALVTSSLNTAVDQTLVITGSLANAADSIVLEMSHVELFTV